MPDERRYVDIDGQLVEVPTADGGRAVTVVERDGRRVAAIIHDESLNEQPELIRAAGAAAALALDNERLQAELRVRLDELSASRARIVRAADLERKRIERNLHDGTQQRLTSIAMALGLAESQLKSDPEAARQNLHQAKTALGAALAELRELSQGIHPAILTRARHRRSAGGSRLWLATASDGLLQARGAPRPSRSRRGILRRRRGVG